MNYTRYKFRPCTLISFSIILILNIISLNGDIIVKRHQDILDDLPRASDLDHYLSILEKAVDFCVENKYGVDMSLDFGLFLAGVTINQVLREKIQKLPPKLVVRLEQVLHKYGEIKDYFNVNVRKGLLRKYGPSAQITHLVYNISSWQLPLDKFNLNLMKRTTIYDGNRLREIYGNWDSYIKTVTNYMSFHPSLEDSDACIARLARLPIFPPTRIAQAKCKLPTLCISYLFVGDVFGYGLAHRLLLFVMAKHSRNCAVFGKEVDKDKMDKFCSTLYLECQYNALNDFAMPDLVFEIVALCGLLGNAQFLTNSWMKFLTTYQTRDGYFNGDIIGMEHIDTNMNVTDQNELNKHTTGTAVAAYANVIRYIIETHY
ncbi:uncharacterized protein LOC111357563 [Spodoptera litura]|uniref:Uncharacterized protein LOC111357563 n=1 Tax=Spodoptera litura TaxID=69820 RepID=A0A9J7EBR3_SPOLT|nr:uncharacterized protein LOC111357563 [Spodoptera litura]